MGTQIIDRTAYRLAADGVAHAAELMRAIAEPPAAGPPKIDKALSVVFAGVVLEHCPVSAEAALRAGHALAIAATRRLMVVPITASEEEPHGQTD